MIPRDSATYSRSEEIVFSSHGITRICGTLHLPSGSQRFPAAIWVHGSGPAVRQSGGELHALLCEAGIAVLSWDKPGCGASTGRFADFPFTHRGDEVHQAVAALRAHPAIDATRIGLIGASQAGWIMPMVAMQDHQLRFLIGISPGTLPFSDRVQLHSGGARDYFQFIGMSHASAEALAQLLLGDILTIYEQNGSAEQVRNLARRFLAEHGAEEGVRRQIANGWLKFADPAQYTDEEHRLMHEAVRCDARSYLAHLRTPVCYAFGAADGLLDPEASAKAVAETLAASDDERNLVLIWPGADHGLRVANARGQLGLPLGFSPLVRRWLRWVLESPE